MVVIGFLCLLAYHEAFGRTLQGVEAFFVVAWIFMPAGLVGLVVASLWGWRRGEGARPLWVLAALVLMGIAVIVMLIGSLLAF